MVGRPPVLREAVLKVISEAEKPLRFSELKERVEKVLGKKVQNKSLAIALNRLMTEGLIDKQVDKTSGKVIYSVTKLYNLQAVKKMIIDMISRLDASHIYPYFEHEDLPTILALTGEQSITFEEDHALLTYTLTDPCRIIANRIIGRLNELQQATRSGISKLIMWSYWLGVQEKKEELMNRISTLIDFSRKKYESSKTEDEKRIERAVISILEMTRKLLLCNSLEEFLTTAENIFPDYLRNRNEILGIRKGYVGSGEKIFKRLVIEKKDIVDSGLWYAGQTSLPTCHGYAGSSIWNIIIDDILEENKEEWQHIKGGVAEAKREVLRYIGYLDPLSKVVCGTGVIVIYMWGIPLNNVDKRYEVIPEFEGWYKALKESVISYRSYLFTHDKLELLRKAYRCVKRGVPPPPRKIDILERWSLQDIYYHHPRGKDPRFWKELLEAYKRFVQEMPLF